MSMQTFLPPSMFKNGSGTSPKMVVAANDGTRSPPTRKLRKARSLTNVFGVANQLPPQTVHGPTATTTGRPHAHSVTGADFPRIPSVPSLNRADSHLRTAIRDIFSDVMHWESGNSSSSASTSTDELSGIRHPFSVGVTFDSPSYRSFTQHLVTPHVLREMQSFESGLTARADPEPRKADRTKLVVGITPVEEPEPPEPATPTPIPAHARARNTMEIRASPSLETSMHSRYSTGVFDVLQNYRGLPLLDKLSANSNETTVIKLSARTEMSAAPKDDPRFVIWGEIHPDDDEGDAMSLSQDSQTDLSSHSGPSRRSTKGKSSAVSPDPPKVRVTVGDTPQKALVAATIERWIAQLTSELNYDELLIFFLTYRTYVSAVDLCHLLICRFHWAVEPTGVPHDDMVKKIVRVRTFIAIRYWLLTFFTVDFVPNRELRLLFGNWLNTLSKDPTLDNTKDVLVSAVVLLSDPRLISWCRTSCAS
jgi:GDP/GTP exchange factor required for growth at low temperature